MSDFLQQLFSFYFRGGWLWMALIPLVLLIFMLIDNQRRHRQALTWILFLLACLSVFAPSLFYSLSEGKALTQSTREIFYAGILGASGAVLGLMGYIVSFQWQVAQSMGHPYRDESVGMAREEESGPSDEDSPTELPGPYWTPQKESDIPNRQPPVTFRPVPTLTEREDLSRDDMPSAFFDRETGDFEDGIEMRSRDLAPGWLEDKTGRQYPLLKGAMHIGREDDQDVRLSEITVSRRHALIRYEQYGKEGVFILQGIGQGETFLNGIMIGKDPKQLYDGDRIRLGTADLTFLTRARS